MIPIEHIFFDGRTYYLQDVGGAGGVLNTGEAWPPRKNTGGIFLQRCDAAPNTQIYKSNRNRIKGRQQTHTKSFKSLARATRRYITSYIYMYILQRRGARSPCGAHAFQHFHFRGFLGVNGTATEPCTRTECTQDAGSHEHIHTHTRTHAQEKKQEQCILPPHFPSGAAAFPSPPPSPFRQHGHATRFAAPSCS